MSQRSTQAARILICNFLEALDPGQPFKVQTVMAHIILNGATTSEKTIREIIQGELGTGYLERINSQNFQRPLPVLEIHPPVEVTLAMVYQQNLDLHARLDNLYETIVNALQASA